MKILERIITNRLLAIVTGFILAVLKIITSYLPPDKDNEPIPPLDPIPPVKRKKIFPLRKKKVKDEE